MIPPGSLPELGAEGLAGYWYVACPVERLSEFPFATRLGSRAFCVTRAADGALQASEGAPPIAERGPYVWAWQGPEPPTAPPPDVPNLGRRGYAYELRSLRLAADWRLVVENALDFSHSAFAHPFVQPSWFMHRLGRWPALEADYRPTPDGLAVEGRLGRLTIFRHEFCLPDRLRLVMLPGSPWAIDVAAYHVPEGRGRSRMEVCFGRPAWPFEARAPRYRADVLAVMRQDQVLVEAQQRLLDAGGPFEEEHCAADAYTLLLRRAVADAARQAWPPAELGTRTSRVRL